MRGLSQVVLDSGDSQVGPGFGVITQKCAVVHVVDMIG
jgi:hypothetical protein